MLRLIYSPSSRLIQSSTAALQIQSKKVIHISTSIEEYIELTFLRRKLFIKNKKISIFNGFGVSQMPIPIFYKARGNVFHANISPRVSYLFGCFLYITTYQQAICANAVIVQVIG